MIKSQLLARLAVAKPHLSNGNVERVVNAIFDEIAKALTHGSRVELRGFCVFFVKTRTARIARNPLTGAAIMVKAKKLTVCKVGKEMRARLNRNAD